MRLITVKTFPNSIEASLLKSKLESEGIDCFMFDENAVQMYPIFNAAIGGIKLKVRQEDIEKTKEVLSEIDSNEK